MAFQPDILVFPPDSHRAEIVVDAELRVPDLPKAAEEIKRYMIRARCPLGMLITPDHLWVYRNFYLGDSPESVRDMGEYDLRSVWLEPPPKDEWQFERFVQRWLDGIGSRYGENLPKDLRDVLQDVIPTLYIGETAAAHPPYA